MLPAVMRFLVSHGVLLDAPWYRRLVHQTLYEHNPRGPGFIRLGEIDRRRVNRIGTWWQEPGQTFVKRPKTRENAK